MEVRAGVRFIRVPPRKARAVGALVKGKHVHDALAILKFTPNASARIIEKLVKSAIANAENNERLDGNALQILRVAVDQGPSMKRIQPRAMGRAYRILKRTSHITVILTEAEAREARGRKATEAAPRRGFLSRRRRPEAEAAHPERRQRKEKAAPAPIEAEEPEVIETPAQEIVEEAEVPEVVETEITREEQPSVEEPGSAESGTDKPSEGKPEGGN